MCLSLLSASVEYQMHSAIVKENVVATLCMNLVSFAPSDFVSLLVLFHTSYRRDQRAKDSLGRGAKLDNNISRVIGRGKGRGRALLSGL